MSKFILSSLLLMFTLPGLSQMAEKSITQKAERVSLKIKRVHAQLDRMDKEDISIYLRRIEKILSFYDTDIVSRNLICDFNGGNLLIDLNQNGKVFYDFQSASDCKEGLERVNRNRPFCDYQGGNLAFSSKAKLIHDFSDASECREGINRIEKKLNFCDYQGGNLLMDHTGKLIYDFSSRKDCFNALK